MRKLFWLFLLAMISSTSAEEILELLWEKPMIKGVDGITIMDFDGDNISELYIFSLDPARSAITILSPDGNTLSDIAVERYQVHLYPTEEIKIIEIADLNDDSNLDVFAGSEAHGGAMNYHLFYRVERRLTRGAASTKLKWIFKESGAITSISTADVDGDGANEIVLSSTDFHVYVLEEDGSISLKYDLGSSVWDIFLLNVEEEGMNLVAGTFQGFVLLKNRSVQWSYPTDNRVLKVTGSDLNGDGRVEILGTSKYHLYALNSSGSEIWTYNLTDTTTNLVIADLENDDSLDVLFGSSTILHAINSNGTLKWELPMGGKVKSIGATDLNGDGYVDLLIGFANKLSAYTLTSDYLKRQEARNNYRKAIELHKAGNYAVALSMLEKARELYLELNDLGQVAGVDGLLNKYRQDAQFKEDLELANENYDRSLNNYFKGNFEKASQLAKKARRIYRELNYSYGVRDCDLLLHMIEIKPTADEYYLEAKAAYIDSDFKSALDYGTKARELFVELDDTNSIKDTEAIITLSKEKLKDQPAQTTVETTLPEIKPKERPTEQYFAVALLVVIGIAMVLIIKKKKDLARKRLSK